MPDDQEYVDFASFSQKLKDFEFCSQIFLIDPVRLRKLDLPLDLQWSRIKFHKDNLSLVIKKPGVYSFGIVHDNSNLPLHGYILYIGQTKGKIGIKTLRERMSEYLGEQKRPKRLGTFFFLNQWKDDLVFSYAPVDPTHFDLKQIEAKLNDAVVPPYSVEDFSPEIRKMKRIRGYKS